MISPEINTIWSELQPRKVRINSTPPPKALRVLELVMYSLLVWNWSFDFARNMDPDSPTFSVFFSSGCLIMIVFGSWGIYTIVCGSRYHAPRINRKLCESGMMIEGSFTGYRRSFNDGIWYSFIHPETGETVGRLAIVYNKPAATKLAVGDKVTVLYDPKNPKKSTVYEVCGYEVVSETEMAAQSS